ncbi:uncharacterized protein LOC133825340 [Humulus lupulus]|uniref:uncharacterized protein LOC133825340 n=1 Tax=Humulus lupulus TaxID=3486 RepID=UPI002B40ACF3|nr:uncharacterized protein LOC133825340 [Humulus lupulus]
MVAYLEKVKEVVGQFEFYPIEQVPWEHNSNADALARLSTTKEVDTLNVVPDKFLLVPSIAEPGGDDVSMINSQPTWMTPIIDYLETESLPADRNEARKLLYKIPR